MRCVLPSIHRKRWVSYCLPATVFMCTKWLGFPAGSVIDSAPTSIEGRYVTIGLTCELTQWMTHAAFMHVLLTLCAWLGMPSGKGEWGSSWLVPLEPHIYCPCLAPCAFFSSTMAAAAAFQSLALCGIDICVKTK